MHIKTEKVPGRQRNRPLKDYTGQRWGRLVALGLVERDPKWNDHRWRFACDCGAETIAGIKQVRGGHTTSCGCAFRERMVERNTTHGLSRKQPAEYRSWKDMRSRCNNPNDSDFASYGGRGIQVCEAWNDFAVFFADMGPRPKGHTLDRIDVNGNYEPGNCRWADAGQQANNKRSNTFYEMDGRTQTLQQWCREFGIERNKVQYRIKQGMTLADALRPEDLRRRDG